VGAVILILFLFVALLPTLVSSSVGRSIVVGQVNSRINGKLEISDLSIGWFSGISVDGVVINDASNRQILQLPHFETKLGLLAAIRGNYNIGQTKVEGLDVLVSREADGSLNWAHLAKASESAQPAGTEPKAPAPAPASGKPEPAREIKLPGVSGELIVSNARITYEDATHQAQPVYLRNMQASVKIPDINQPITDSFSAEAQIGTQKPGTLNVDGAIAAIANNVLQTTPSQLDQTIKLNGLDVGAVMGLLGKTTTADLTGRAQGQVVVHLIKGSGTADASVEVANVNLAHGHGPGARPILTNDTFSFVTNAKYAESPSGREIRISQLKVGDSAGTFSVQKSAEGDVVAVLPQTGNPTAQGGIDIAANLKALNDIAQAFSAPAVAVKDPNGLEFQSGKVAGKVVLTQATGDQIAVTGDLAITQITVGNSTSAPLKDQSITIALKAQANHDLSKVTPEVHATGDLFTADVTMVELNMGGQPGESPVDMLKKATITAKVPSLPKMQALIKSFSSPKPATVAPSTVAMRPGPALASVGQQLPRGAVPAPAGTQPLKELPTEVTQGSLAAELGVSTSNGVIRFTPHVTVADLQLTSGNNQYAIAAINLKVEGSAYVSGAAPVSHGEDIAVGSYPKPAEGVFISNTDITIGDLVINNRPYPERQFRITGRGALMKSQNSLGLTDFKIEAVNTKSLVATLNGGIVDLGASQRIDNVFTLDLTYDAGGLLNLAMPFLSADLQKRLSDAKAAGNHQERFEVRGAYPAGKPFNEAVQQLAMSGRLEVESFEGAGVAMTKLDLPITMAGGFARIIYADKPTGQNLPPAAGFNGGKLTLAGSQVDLRGATPLLTTVGNLRLIENAGLNPVFAAWSLGTILANPIFVGADKATGYLTITMVNCEGLPLDSTLTGTNSGTATLDLSIAQLSVVNGLIEKLSTVARFDKDSIRGDIPKWRIMISQGIADQDLTMTIGQNQRPLKMYGKVRLSDKELLPLTIDLPWKLFGIKGAPKEVAAALPDGIQIPMTGTIDKPQFSFDFNKLVADSAGKNLGNLVPGILGGKTDPKNGGTTQPGENDPLKAIGDLLDQATKKKKKK
jgi:hypothetical protein